VAAQQSRLLALACRTMARPLGRGALTLGELAPAGATCDSGLHALHKANQGLSRYVPMPVN
jgi:hypothetical protein